MSLLHFIKSALRSISMTMPDCEEKRLFHRYPHNGRQDRAIHNLVVHGEISLAEIGGNCPAKVVMCLREKGYLKPHGAPNGERWETNHITGCDFKVYIWTGKLPPKWIETPNFRGKDRRKKPRGKQ